MKARIIAMSLFNDNDKETTIEKSKVILFT